MQARRWFVTYCTMDKEHLGSNPGWHALLVLSIWDPGCKMWIETTFTFYPQKSTSTLFPVKQLKECFMNIDFTGNYGLLREEALRFLDQGVGLRGATFNISEQDYVHLIKRCRNIEAGQKQAINEATAALQVEGHDNPSTIDIYRFELAAAQMEYRAPRLREFNLAKACLSRYISFDNADNCKTLAISLLYELNSIPKEELAQLQVESTALPRYSGQLEKIYFHSRGELQAFEKDGKVSLFREWKTAQLFWTLPPQLMITVDPFVIEQFTIPEPQVSKLKLLVSQLQRLEKIVEHEMKIHKQENAARLIKHVRAYYTFLYEAHVPERIDRKIKSIEAFFTRLRLALDNQGEADSAEMMVSTFVATAQDSILKILDESIEKFSAPAEKKQLPPSRFSY